MFKSLAKRYRSRKKALIHTAVQASISDIGLARQRQATQDTAHYVQEHMPDIQSVTTWRAVHDAAFDARCISDGLILEFGVFKGSTINHIASKTAANVHGFDSFEGLPSDWRDGYPKGHFARGDLPEVSANVTLHKGWFEDSIPVFREASEIHRRAISYLHLDGDLYASAEVVFRHFKDQIVPGTVIVFDEYFNYPGWRDGEYKAFQEFIAATGKTYKYLTYNRQHQQVAVKIIASETQ